MAVKYTAVAEKISGFRAALAGSRVRSWQWTIPAALLIILVAAAGFRLYGLSWDTGFGAYPHPDERHLANTITHVKLPPGTPLSQLLDARTSPLNPRRVNPEDGQHYDLAYGALPVYVYKGVAALGRELGSPRLDTYDGYFLVGRAVTVFFALITVLLAYAIGALLYGPLAGLLAAALLSLSVTHIQLAHFMTVDLALTMFITGGLYWGLRLARRGGAGNALLLGMSLGGAMACKVSGATLLAGVVPALVFWLLRGPFSRRSWLTALGVLLLIVVGFFLIFGLFEFYVLLDPQPYLDALSRQSSMASGTNDWPFTRQYVNTAPFLYPLENLVRWGLGWPLGLAVVIAVLWAVGRILFALVAPRGAPTEGVSRLRGWWRRMTSAFFGQPALWGAALLLAWVLPYFLYIGSYEVKFVRYMLPLVPLLCVLAAGLLLALARVAGRGAQRLSLTAWGQQHLFGGTVQRDRLPRWPQQVAAGGLVLLVLLPTLVWALAFMRIYQRPHTWLEASRWLYNNAEQGAVVSAENWDDSLPVDISAEGYHRGSLGANVAMDIYHDMAPDAKFKHLTDVMRRSDYIVLATNRLYGAVRRLPWRYPVEIKYYQLLFQEKLGFELAHVSVSYPSIWGMTFVDDSADESFSVYDHPKVLIYRKIRDLSEAELRGLFGATLQSQPLITRLGAAPPVTLPVPQFRKTLMLDVPVDALPDVGDYGWNRWASADTIPAVLVWLVVFALLSWAAVPLSWALFGGFADRGVLLARPLGLLLVAYLSWIPASLGLWHYTVWAVALATGLVALLSFLVVRRRRAAWQHFWRTERALIVRVELLFLAVFLIGLLLRLGNPDLWHPVNGGEKPMEFGFLNAILRSPTMPPLDPFFSGGYINYYYYGLFVVSILVKLTGIMPGVAFNLIIASLFAMTFAGAYAVVATLVKRPLVGLIGGWFVVMLGPLAGALTIRGRGGFGEVIAALQRLADPGARGALARLGQGFWRWLGPEVLPLRSDWFWDASRAHGSYENTITEFPFWSLLFADLHPHTINIPFTILAIALALRIAQGRGAEEPATERRSLAPWALLLITAIVLGALMVGNSWDFPTFVLLTAGSLALGHWVTGVGGRWQRLATTVGATLIGTALVAPLSLLLYFPFFTHFQAFVKGLGWVRYPTEFNYYLGFFGVFLFLIVTYGLWRMLQYVLERRAALAPALVAEVAAERWPANAPFDGAEPEASSSLPTSEVAKDALVEVPAPIAEQPEAELLGESGDAEPIALPEASTLAVTEAITEGHDPVVQEMGPIVEEETDRPPLLYSADDIEEEPGVWEALPGPSPSPLPSVDQVEEPLSWDAMDADAPPPVLSASGMEQDEYVEWVDETPVPLAVASPVLAAQEPAPQTLIQATRSARRWRLALPGWWPLAAVALVLVIAPLLARPLYAQLNLKQMATFAVMGVTLLLLGIALFRGQNSSEERFASWLALVGLLVTLGVEVVYMRDHLGDTWYRMNTIFKFYVHSWVILALAAAAALGLLARSRSLRGRQPVALLWWSTLGVLLFLVGVYPVFATVTRWRDRFPIPPEWGTLDGLAYMETASYNWEGHQIYLEPDYQAIQWLIANVKGTPVILQAPYGFYRENGVRIAANTGFPTVLNPLHENEQRYDELVGPRHRDADNIFKTTDASEAARLLAKYGVSYVYVGPFEKSVYPPASLDKFETMLDGQLELVYDQAGVRIYHVSLETRRAFGGIVPESARPVVVPTVQPQQEIPLDRDALRELERAAAASPDNAGLQFELGDRYRKMGRPEDATKVFERSLKYHPDDVAMYHTLGDTYMTMGQSDKALQQYIKATEVAQSNAPAFNKLGIAYLDRGQLPDAVVAFQQAVAKDAKFAEAYFHLGEAYQRQGNKAAAKEAYQKAQQQGAGSDWETRAGERLRTIEQ